MAEMIDVLRFDCKGGRLALTGGRPYLGGVYTAEVRINGATDTSHKILFCLVRNGIASPLSDTVGGGEVGLNTEAWVNAFKHSGLPSKLMVQMFMFSDNACIASGNMMVDWSPAYTVVEGEPISLQGEPGATGEVGPQGPKGDKGDKGDSGFVIRGLFSTLVELQLQVPAPNPGDTYIVGAEAPYALYIWDAITGTWIFGGSYSSAGAVVLDPVPWLVRWSIEDNDWIVYLPPYSVLDYTLDRTYLTKSTLSALDSWYKTGLGDTATMCVAVIDSSGYITFANSYDTVTDSTQIAFTVATMSAIELSAKQKVVGAITMPGDTAAEPWTIRLRIVSGTGYLDVFRPEANSTSFTRATSADAPTQVVNVATPSESMTTLGSKWYYTGLTAEDVVAAGGKVYACVDGSGENAVCSVDVTSEGHTIAIQIAAISASSSVGWKATITRTGSIWDEWKPGATLYVAQVADSTAKTFTPITDTSTTLSPSNTYVLVSTSEHATYMGVAKIATEDTMAEDANGEPVSLTWADATMHWWDHTTSNTEAWS